MGIDMKDNSLKITSMAMGSFTSSMEKSMKADGKRENKMDMANLHTEMKIKQSKVFGRMEYLLNELNNKEL